MSQRQAAARARGMWRQILHNEFFPTDRRRDIDGLRGLAIVFVVLFHAGWLDGGFIGVDIFIVISGYFIGRSALIQQPFQPMRFISRRLYRLLPALFCMVAAISAGMLWWVLQSDRADIALNGAYALVYLSNIWAAGHVGYFEGQSIAYPFLHTWSLSLEMQFYLVIFLIALVLPYTHHRNRGLVAIFLLSLGCSLYSNHTGHSQAYYNILDRLWEFSLGTLIWIMPRPRFSRAVSNIICGLGVAFLFYAAFFYPLSFACPSYMIALPCLAVMAIIMCPQHDVARMLLVPVSPMGVISYSIYLWHWPAIVMANYLLMFQVHGLVMGGVLALVMVISLLSYVGIERVFLDYEGRVTPSVRNCGALALVGLCAGLAGVLSYVSFVSRVH
ncbi:acyltransferase family protein [Komagataeibacter kakiaceti]